MATKKIISVPGNADEVFTGSELDLAVDLAKCGCYKEALEIFIYNITFTEDPRAISYYALCRALVDKDINSAESLCRLAMLKDCLSADIFLNSAKIFYIMGNRREAVLALIRGLSIDGEHKGLKKFGGIMHMRKGSAIPFLSRDNVANVLLGKLMARRRKHVKEAMETKKTGKKKKDRTGALPQI
ncbi:MAG: hypothetical protein KAR06_01930 [Deltaproteobacteria bacterium]|nr:hypothetical protein [Deltaproteobacteria bacterium]